MINLFVSMANNCKIILEMKVNQIMSYFLVFSLPMPLLPLKKKPKQKKNYVIAHNFLMENRLAVVIEKQKNKYSSHIKKKKISD